MAGRGRVVFDDLPVIAQRVQQMLYDVALATAGTIADRAAASMEGQEPPSPPGHAPAIRSGLLHGSLRVAGKSSGAHIEAETYTDVEYAQHLEYGTIFMESRPFLRPAAEAVRPEYEKAVRAALRRAS